MVRDSPNRTTPKAALIFIVVSPRVCGDWLRLSVFIVVTPRGHNTKIARTNLAGGLLISSTRCTLFNRTLVVYLPSNDEIPATEVASDVHRHTRARWALCVGSPRAYKFSGVLLATNTLMCVSMLTLYCTRLPNLGCSHIQPIVHDGFILQQYPK